MGVDGRIDTNQTMNWQRDVSSFLSSLTEFVNAFDVDKLTEEQKTKALKSLQKLVPPSAPATDGGVADTLRNVVAETKRLNNISFAGGCVVNNANGIGLFLEPNANESGGKPYGPILMPPVSITPDPHDHTTPALTHSTHSHLCAALSHTGWTCEDSGHDHDVTMGTETHTHTYDHHHIVYDSCGAAIGYTGPVIVDATTAAATAPSQTGQTASADSNTANVELTPVDHAAVTTSGSIVPQHDASETGDTSLTVELA